MQKSQGPKTFPTYDRLSETDFDLDQLQVFSPWIMDEYHYNQKDLEDAIRVVSNPKLSERKQQMGSLHWLVDALLENTQFVLSTKI